MHFYRYIKKDEKVKEFLEKEHQEENESADEERDIEKKSKDLLEQRYHGRWVQSDILNEILKTQEYVRKHLDFDKFNI